MQIGTTLELEFLTSTDKTYTLTIRDPKENLTRAAVVAAMEDIIDADVFETAQGESLATVSDCYYKTVSKTILTNPGGGE